MLNLTDAFLELVRLTSTDLASDAESALVSARQREAAGSAAQGALDTILENVNLARQNSTPICQDTGTPIFYIHHPQGWSTRQLTEQIRAAVAEATARAYLRPNAVNALTAKNSGNNLGGYHYPSLHFIETEDDGITADLILKGGGCENVGAQYSLPNTRLGAGRDLRGVRAVVLDMVFNAQGKGCAPGVLGVAIGGDRGTSYLASKEALLRKLDDTNPDPELAKFEAQLLEDANRLKIGPMGFGGATTVLGVKVNGLYRLPASYFVSISYMCWAYRRRRMIVDGDRISYE
ncbi:MAG: fumarate hydratase [Anaerolineales bacterium]|jgi:fumarate hydratase class I